MYLEYNQKLIVPVQSSEIIKRKLLLNGAIYLEKRQLKDRRYKAELQEEIFKLGSIKFFLFTYPFLGSFIGVYKDSDYKKILSIIKLSIENLKEFNLERDIREVEEKRRRGLILTFEHEEMLKDAIARRRFNMRRYGINSSYIFTYIDLEINSMCNRRCNYCPNSKYQRKSQGFMSLKLVKKILKELKEINYDHYINYNFYGEPLLDNRLEQILSLAKQFCPKARNQIFTNGDFLTLKRFRKLIRAGATYFVVTLHSGFMYRHIKEILDSISFGEKAKITVFFPKQLVMHNRAGLVKCGVAMNRVKNLPCFRPAFNIVITIDGNVLSCCDDFLETTVMGNVFHQTLKDIWTSKRFIEFREDIIKGNRLSHKLCRNCNNIVDINIYLPTEPEGQTKTLF